jgi:NAD(P)-dependent dehydrogenase (short-subunit alcohol dehydrogenase family)
MDRLSGKSCLITGAASGIGKECAKAFAKEGACLTLVDRDKNALEKLLNELTPNEKIEAIDADVTNEAQISAAVNKAIEKFGYLNAAVNCAGIFPDDDGGLLETRIATWDKVMEVNLKGIFLCCREEIKAMLTCGQGSVVNIASFVALMGAATAQVAYTASKGAVLSFSREIAVEYARKKIRVNAICPGPIETPLLKTLLSDEVRRQRRLVHIPMGRFGQAHEIAMGALFLISDESSFITGASLVIDGGITAAYVTPE